MNVDERDALMLADAATLRAAGFDVPDGYEDCANPGPEWVAEVSGLLARDRQTKAIKALKNLTVDDVAALLTAIQEAR
jgi:hypothetical protein